MDVLDIETPEITDAPTLSALLESLPETRRRIVQAWIDGLTAMKWQWDFGAKKRFIEPDHKIRSECATKLAAYLEGMPAQTTIIRVPAAQVDQLSALRTAASESPAMRETLREMLAELEKPAELGN